MPHTVGDVMLVFAGGFCLGFMTAFKFLRYLVRTIVHFITCR